MGIQRKVGNNINTTRKICRVVNGVVTNIVRVMRKQGSNITTLFDSSVASFTITEFTYRFNITISNIIFPAFQIVGSEGSTFILVRTYDGGNRFTTGTQTIDSTGIHNINTFNYANVPADVQQITFSIEAVGDTILDPMVVTSVTVDNPLASPTVTAIDNFNLGATSFTPRASAVSNSRPIVSYGFNYGTSATNLNQTILSTNIASNGVFSVDIVSLTQETDYFWQAFATDDNGNTGMSEVTEATTTGAPTGAIDIITGSSVDIDGVVTIETSSSGFVYYLGVQQTGGTTYTTNVNSVSLDLFDRHNVAIGLTRLVYLGIEVDDPTAINDGTQLQIFQYVVEGVQPGDGSVSITHLVPDPVETTSATLRGAINTGGVSAGVTPSTVDFYWLIDNTDRDAAYIVANGTRQSEATLSGSIAEDITYSSSSSVRQLQVVIRADTTNSIVQRASIPAQTATSSITTGGVTEVGSTRMVLNGSYTVAAGRTFGSVGFIWSDNRDHLTSGINSTNGQPINSNANRILAQSNQSPFAAGVSSLTQGTTYYYRAIGFETNGWLIGDIESQATNEIVVTYAAGWRNNGSTTQSVSIVETDCNAPTTASCGTTAQTCDTTGTFLRTTTTGNVFQPEIWDCIGSDGSLPADSFCTSNGGRTFGTTRNRDTGSGSGQTQATIACGFTVPNTGLVSTPEFTADDLNARCTGTIPATGGTPTVNVDYPGTVGVSPIGSNPGQTARTVTVTWTFSGNIPAEFQDEATPTTLTGTASCVQEAPVATNDADTGEITTGDFQIQPGGNTVINITTNGDWRLSSESDRFRFSPSSGGTTTGQNITVSTNSNYSGQITNVSLFGGNNLLDRVTGGQQV